MKLHEQAKHHREIIEAYAQGMRDLETYLRLPKFNEPNNMVNVNDIFLRVNETKSNISTIQLGDLF
tara:strand:+ start:195 stop:392 length:198 start_codon:yes stop_codon:yes gene_type:complete